METNFWTSPSSQAGQAHRIIESLYWKGQLWFIVSMILIVVVIALLVVLACVGLNKFNRKHVYYIPEPGYKRERKQEWRWSQRYKGKQLADLKEHPDIVVDLKEGIDI